MTKISTKDWRNLPIEKWNVTSFHAFLIDETKRRYNAEYVPGGKGSKSQRWATEKGMLKREIQRRGPETVRKFIEICWRDYRTSNPQKFPFPTFGFMLGFQDRNWTEAERSVSEILKDSDLTERSDSNAEVAQMDESWF